AATRLAPPRRGRAAGGGPGRAAAAPRRGRPGPRPGCGRGPTPPAVSRAAPAPDAGDYKLAAKDQITVTVYGQDDLTRTLRVSQTGTVTLPLLGEIPAAGLSATELEQKIETGLRGKYLVNPKVNVTVAEFQGRQVAVMGG